MITIAFQLGVGMAPNLACQGAGTVSEEVEDLSMILDDHVPTAAAV